MILNRRSLYRRKSPKSWDYVFVFFSTHWSYAFLTLIHRYITRTEKRRRRFCMNLNGRKHGNNQLGHVTMDLALPSGGYPGPRVTALFIFIMSQLMRHLNQWRWLARLYIDAIHLLHVIIRHSDRVTHQGVSKLGHHNFKKWLVAWSTPCHFLDQWLFIDHANHGNKHFD